MATEPDSVLSYSANSEHLVQPFGSTFTASHLYAPCTSEYSGDSAAPLETPYHSFCQSSVDFIFSSYQMFNIVVEHVRDTLGLGRQIPSREYPLLAETISDQYVETPDPQTARTPGSRENEKLMFRRWTVVVLLIMILGCVFLSFLDPSIFRSSFLESLPSSLRYRDTRIDSMSSPEALESVKKDGSWSFGDTVIGTNRTAGEKNVSDGSSNLIDTEIPPSFLDYSNDDDDDDERGHEIELNELWGEEPAEYSRDDPTVDASPIYFSDMTLRNKEGEIRKNRDDEMCRSAGKYTEYDPEKCLGAPYLYVTFHGGNNVRKRIRNVCKYSRDGCSLGSALMPSNKYIPHSLRGLLHHNNYLFVAEAWRMVRLHDHCLI